VVILSVSPVPLSSAIGIFTNNVYLKQVSNFHVFCIFSKGLLDFMIGLQMQEAKPLVN
jgi:hypothetical protein